MSRAPWAPSADESEGAADQGLRELGLLKSIVRSLVASEALDLFGLGDETSLTRISTLLRDRISSLCSLRLTTIGIHYKST
jgi:hypothetical protein